ncbi:MAG: phosphate ABC transporter permease subunit PstC, partial [Methanosarcina sp.]
MFNRNYKEKVIESVLFSVSALTVVILFLICLFLFRDSLLLFKDTSLLDFLTGKFWYPTSVNRQFGLLPLFFGSLIVTAGAILFAVPLGIASAIYISEIAHPKVAQSLKPFIEILAGIPSVVFGFFGLVILVPAVQNLFNLPTG